MVNKWDMGDYFYDDYANEYSVPEDGAELTASDRDILKKIVSVSAKKNERSRRRRDNDDEYDYGDEENQGICRRICGCCCCLFKNITCCVCTPIKNCLTTILCMFLLLAALFIFMTPVWSKLG